MSFGLPAICENPVVPVALQRQLALVDQTFLDVYKKWDELVNLFRILRNPSHLSAEITLTARDLDGQIKLLTSEIEQFKKLSTELILANQANADRIQALEQEKKSS